VLARIGRGFLWAVAAYFVGAFVGYWLIMWLSSNTHDRSMEAGMTSAFVLGPLSAFVGFIAGVLRRPGSSGQPDTATDH
jgi:uncharacterized membrane protein YeaQ/YmgE (transglycosylase-associated protein family)